MVRFILKRLGIGLVLVWIVLTLIFLSLHLVPGDPAALLLSGEGGAAPTPEALAKVREGLGLNDPFLLQYWNYLTGLLQGDLGSSFRDGTPVLAFIADRLPKTLELVLVAAVIAVVVGVPLGALAARRGGATDTAVSLFTTVGLAVPVYVIGTVFVLLFALNLRLFPAGGYTDFSEDPAAHLSRLILPAIAIAMGITAVMARMTRSSVLETMGQDWVRTARSVGLSRSQVFSRHVMRNSLNPVVTSFGLEVGTLIGSTVLIERVFNWPGLGSLLVDGVLQRDYPVVQGVVIIISILFILINIVVDISYGLLDPRVRQS
jgi:peptide/nickel transport system permease protein